MSVKRHNENQVKMKVKKKKKKKKKICHSRLIEEEVTHVFFLFCFVLFCFFYET